MSFAWPWILLGAATVPVLVMLIFRWSEARSLRKLAAVIAPRLREQLLRSVNFARRWYKALLVALAFAALFVALARPQAGFKSMEVERSSVDFLIAIDLSRSMLAEDVETKARLGQAKAGLNKMLDQLGNDRVGLIGFAGEAFLAAPITQDIEAVKRNLAPLNMNAVAQQGSDIAKALRLGIKTFENGKYETKAIVLVSDGEELQGDAVIAAREASQKGISIFTVGVGSTLGARIPERSGPRDTGLGRFAKNEFGRDVVTRLNERMLQQLASNGRGFYEPLGKDGAGLLSVWRRGLEPLAKGTQIKQSNDLDEIFQWPLAIGIILLLAEMLVSDRRKRHPAAPNPAKPATATTAARV